MRDLAVPVEKTGRILVLEDTVRSLGQAIQDRHSQISSEQRLNRIEMAISFTDSAADRVRSYLEKRDDSVGSAAGRYPDRLFRLLLCHQLCGRD